MGTTTFWQLQLEQMLLLMALITQPEDPLAGSLMATTFLTSLVNHLGPNPHCLI
ncbi:hypothetical protein GLYMA_19G250167v4 [Glycine max]|nr:hypothetical protein GLYMA_19G250167v4 [Glycine max]KAH1079476.1 hypothetical protein GYH30_054164 [Glycine max]